MNNKPFKINRKDYKNIYFLSDAHINHDRPWIVGARGFDSVDEHDKWILDQLYTLNADDLLINIGDFTLMSSVEKTHEILNGIKCRHFYAANGNHESFMSKIYYQYLDKFWKSLNLPNYSPVENTKIKFAEIYPLTVFNNYTNVDIIDPSYSNNSHNITFFGESSNFQIGNHFFFCRHMATYIYDKMKYPNHFAICGHSHGNCKEINPEYQNFNKILDIGVDNAMNYNNSAFFTMEEIVDIMSTKNLNLHDHHGDDNI